MSDIKFANHKREIERQIIVLLVEDLLKADYSIGVNNGEEDVLDFCQDENAIYAAMSTTDEENLLLAEKSEEGYCGWIRLIYGNDTNVISDYTVNIPESVFTKANELAERFQ